MNATLSAIALSFALASTQPVLAAEAVNASHLHLGHVMTQWHDTPERQGLLTTAINEAKIAQVHAQAAAKQPDNLQWMQLHSTHVLHALDPSAIAKGPGKGYGVIKAAKGVTQHIKVAAKQADASEALKLHSVHVATAAGNALTWAEEALDLCRDIEKAGTAQQAAPLVEQLIGLIQRIQVGTDANGDGAVTWHQGEGGLEASHKHARVIAKLDGVN
jgi:hypothetical protein